MSSIRFGVIGLSRGQSFVKACQAVGGATVTALFDIDYERATEVASQYKLQAFGDIESFLASDIDAVVVASPLPYHAAQSIAALNAGKHVLSEVTACISYDEARMLVQAARDSNAIYMLSENYRYFDEVELIKRMHDEKRFGEVYFGEGEYIHDCQSLWFNDDGSLTWRGRGNLGVYGTHSLGPLLYITGDRVKEVSALRIEGGKYDPRVTIPTMHLLHLVTDGGITFRVRVDHVSRRPHQMAYYSLQGTAGSYEAWRGMGDTSKVWLEDEHTPTRWHPLDEQAQRYIPDRLAAPPEAKAGGHGTSEYWLLRDFLAACRGEQPVPIDIYRALDYTLPGIAAVESAASGGAPIRVPDPRTW